MRNISEMEEEEQNPSLSSESNAVCIPHRRSFSYQRLPVNLLKLTVLKLDGSSFDVQVPRMASVRELKMAVEEVFDESLKGNVMESISWVHVWGQFCLSYCGNKLIEDKAMLKDFGIKDSDQLHFVRHHTFSSIPIKQRRKSQEASSECRRMSWSGEELDFEFEDSATVNKRSRELPSIIKEDSSQSAEEVAIDGSEEEILAIKYQWQFKLSRYLKGFLCYPNYMYMTKDR